MPALQKTFNVPEAARKLGISEAEIAQEIRAGTLKSSYVELPGGAGRLLVISSAEIARRMEPNLICGQVAPESIIEAMCDAFCSPAYKNAPVPAEVLLEAAINCFVGGRPRTN